MGTDIAKKSSGCQQYATLWFSTKVGEHSGPKVHVFLPHVSTLAHTGLRPFLLSQLAVLREILPKLNAVVPPLLCIPRSRCEP